jgi:hypothetical protein
MTNETGQPKKNICPLMSDSRGEVSCIKNRCEFWRSITTTEYITHNDCIIAVAPEMVDGLRRV